MLSLADKSFKDASFKLEVSQKGDGELAFTSSNEKVAKVDKEGNVTIVGAGEVSIKVSAAESTNYNKADTTITFTVKKIDHVLTVTKTAYDVSYGDASFNLGIKADDAEAEVKYSNTNDSVATVDENGNVTVKNAGTTTITVSMAGSGNYNAVSQDIVINVAKKTATVTVSDAAKHIGTDDPEYVYNVTGLVGNDTLSGISVSRETGETNSLPMRLYIVMFL